MIWQNLSVAGDDGPIVVHQAGLGPPILMLPSLGRPATDLLQAGEALAAMDFRVVAMEFRGCGGSGGLRAGLTLDDYVSDVSRVISVLALAPVHVVGAPFGSRVVRRMINAGSPLLASATIVAAGGSIPPDVETLSAARRFMAGIGKDDPAQLGSLAGELYFSPGHRVPSDWLEGEWLKGWSVDAMNAQRAALHAAGSEEDASGVPVLILQGADDRIAPAQNARLLVEKLGPTAQLIELAGAGHMLLVERPLEAAEAIAAFVLRQTGTLERSH